MLVKSTRREAPAGTVQKHKPEKKQAIGEAGTAVALIGEQPFFDLRFHDQQQDHAYNAAFN
jgi:hypothetical protein